jgi:hypothetical protein
MGGGPRHKLLVLHGFVGGGFGEMLEGKEGNEKLLLAAGILIQAAPFSQQRLLPMGQPYTREQCSLSMLLGITLRQRVYLVSAMF